MQATALPGVWSTGTREHWRALLGRTLLLILLFGLELGLISVWLDGETVQSRPGLAGLIGLHGAFLLRTLVGFGCLFLAFSYLKCREALADVALSLTRTRVSLVRLAAHFAAMAAFAFCSTRLFDPAGPTQARDGWAALWMLTGSAGLISGLTAFYPWESLRLLKKATGNIWLFSAGAAMLAVGAIRMNQALWTTTAGITFRMVEFLLRPILPNLIANPETLTFRAQHFAVQVAPECSGLEGMGLFLVFGLTFLWLFKDECRFPQAWALLPVGALLLFGLNSVRIAALLLIGEAGAKEIARGGFHSQAGWMAFNTVAFGTILAARRLPWFSLRSKVAQEPVAADNATAAFLLPFLAILGAGMLASAGTAKFEWLYPIRVLAAVPVLWMFRQRYRTLDWRVGWPAALAGILTFLIWTVADQFLRGTPALPMPAELAAASGGMRIFWLTFRVMGAVLTVPVAEELAFRGFLLRRVGQEHFEQAGFTQAGLWGILISSVAFGLMHGSRWPEGIAAGLLFAWAARRSGRMGDAVVAHALTNGLLALYVLQFQQWQYW